MTLKGDVGFDLAGTDFRMTTGTATGGTGSTFNRDGYITVVMGSDTKYIQLYDWD